MEKEKKAVVVTGGASTIGKAIALQLVSDGYAVCIMDKDATAGEAAAKAVGAVFVRYDVANSAAEAPAAMEAAYKALGRIDALVNAADARYTSPVFEITPEAFDRVMDVNVKGVLFTSIAAAEYLRRNENGGNIVNVSSIQGRIAVGDHAVYSASKGAVMALTRELAVDLSPLKIKCNSLATWALDTPEMAAEYDRPGVREQVLSTLLLDRLISPEDVSELVSFLVSDDSYCINGFDMPLDAGMTTFRDRPVFSGFAAEGKNYYN